MAWSCLLSIIVYGVAADLAQMYLVRQLVVSHLIGRVVAKYLLPRSVPLVRTLLLKMSMG